MAGDLPGYGRLAAARSVLSPEYALEQLRAVEAQASGLFSVDAVRDAERAGGHVKVEATVSCAGLERAEGGLPL
jgi:hypothetical protein